MSSPRREADVVVVGGGVVGLACAYALAKRNVRTIVIEASSHAAGAGWRNAGWIAAAPPIVAPVPGPGVVGTSVRWLTRRHSPLRIIPRADLDYARWIVGFARSCSVSAADAGLRATLALNATSNELFDGLEREIDGLEMERSGVLVVYGSQAALTSARHELPHATDDGEALTRDEVLDREPLLNVEGCVGGTHYFSDRFLRPERLLDGLVRRLGEMGATVHNHQPCHKVLRDRDRIAGVLTPSGVVRGGTYVLATGASISQLTRHIGVRMPVVSGRGYSFDIPHERLPLRAPVYIHDGRLALTPFRDVTRVVGMMELGVRNASVRPGAIKTMNHLCAASFRAWPTVDGIATWAGLRPMTPDGLPIVGRATRFDNLYLACGHGMLGLTLSLRTGELLARCIVDRSVDQVLQPFAPARFDI